MTIKRPHDFIVTEIKVYPTNDPSKAKEKEPRTQTIKIDAIKKAIRDREDKPK